jgi:hypothetical protein
MFRHLADWWASTLWARVRWGLLALLALPTLCLDLGIYFLWYQRPAVIGLLGDLYNFGAGVWFAFDLLFRDREAEETAMISQLQKDIAGKVSVTIDGVILTDDPKSVNRFVNRRKAGEALSACIMLGLGLTLVLVARILEFAEQGKLEQLWLRTTK